MHTENTTSKVWVLLCAGSVALVALPFFVVDFPPVTDLPQHLAQIRLLGEVQRGDSDLYAVNWLWPNTLIYGLIGLGWVALPLEHVGRLVMVVLAAGWVTAAFWVARRRRRDAGAAMLASLLVFSHPMYWGLLGFLLGWPVFLLWLLATAEPANEKVRWPAVFRLTALAALLYASHALWFLMGMVWLGIAGLATRARPATWVFRTVTVMPVFVAAAIWYPQMAELRSAAGFDVAMRWSTPVWMRFYPAAIVEAAFGGLRGWVEPALASVVLVWIGASIGTNRRAWRSETDRLLLIAGLCFLALGLFGPDAYMDTILLRSRWFPCAVILLILALPAPRVGAWVSRVVAAAALTACCVFSSTAWASFERIELTGLRTALQEVPPASRVLGLDFVKSSQFLRERPFMQMLGYAQVFAGADLNFSFAEHGSGLVRYRRAPEWPWTPSLEWYAERVTNVDLLHFDYALVNATAPIHTVLESQPLLSALAQEGRWRLYRVVKGTSPGASGRPPR